MYEGEVTELTPEFTEAAAAGQGAGAGYGKVRGPLAGDRGSRLLC